MKRDSFPILTVTSAPLLVFALIVISLASQAAESPHPVIDPASTRMLAGAWMPVDPKQIDHDKLPRVPGEHVVVNRVRDQQGVNQHNYLACHAGRFFLMWSDGPGIEDRVGQRVMFATSADGLKWSAARYLTPVPPHSGPDSKYYNARSDQGWRYIARGFWQREGGLLALAALDEAAGYFGASLALHAFRWNASDESWQEAGVIANNALVSNSNPRKRDPLTLALSDDGMVFNKLIDLIGGRQVDYPHAIEHQGQLFIAFSGAKQSVEVLRIKLADLDTAVMPAAVTLTGQLPPGGTGAKKPTGVADERR